MNEFSLDDFTDAKYQDLPEYAECGGIDRELVRAIHSEVATLDSQGAFGIEHIWFMHRDGPFRFGLYVYDVNTWSTELVARTVDPFVLIHGTTFDGVRACWFSDTEPSNLANMAKALSSADKLITERGWGV